MVRKEHKKGGISILLFVLLCMFAIIGAMLVSIYRVYKEKYAGESVVYSRQLIKELDENSFDYTMVKLFYSDEQLESIRSDEVVAVSAQQEDDEETEDIEIIPIYGSTYEGYMMLVHNPEDISVAVNPYLSSGSSAPALDEYVSMYNAIGGINGGGFIDVGGKGDGSIPQGIVIHDGEVVYGDPTVYQAMIGIDSNGKLICTNCTGNDLISWGVQEAVTFGPVFINNYEVVYEEGTDNLGMLNPRTAIGQRSDGTFMLLVVDGRGPSSFGAWYEDIIEIFQENDAVMAANLDGGNSSCMIYDGEYVNYPVSMYNSRNLPTVFLVKGEN